MANNNVQNVKFLRNGSVFTPTGGTTARAIALNAMNGQLDNLADGTAILGRYQETNGVVKTLVGFAYVSGNTKTLTVFDVDGAGADVDEKIDELREEINNKLGNEFISSSNTVEDNLTALSGDSATAQSGDTSVWGAKAYAKDYTDEQISSLDYIDTAVTGSYVSAVNEADGKISVSRLALPDAGSVADANKVVTDVTQSKGAITATASNITGVKLAGYEEGTDADIAATDTLGQALGKLQAQINAMDKDASAVNGQVVTTVSETDGKVSETKVNVKDLQLGGYSKETTATGDIASTDTINAALSKLENKAAAITIASADKTIKVTTASTGTDISVNIDGTTLIKNSSTGVISSDLKIKSIAQGAGSTYASQYQLVYGNSETPIGDVISVAKDQFLKAADYDPTTQKLILTMYTADGTTTDIEVDFSAAVIEAEAGEGLYVKEDHSLNVGIDAQSEAVITGASNATGAVLSVSADSIKVQNIQNAIDYKVSTLDATVGSTTVASGKHVAVQVSEADGVLTAVTVNESNIADADDLENLSAKTITEVASSNNSITAALSAATDGTKHLDIITDASKIKMTGFTSTDVLSGINATSSVTEAFKEVDKVITDNEQIVSAALNDLEEAKAEKTTLEAEITARKAVDGQNGDTYAANTNANYINDATSLNDADVKLDAALKAVDETMLTGVVAGNGIAVTTKANKSQTISAKVKNDDGIVNDADGLHLGTIDCGTY